MLGIIPLIAALLPVSLLSLLRHAPRLSCSPGLWHGDTESHTHRMVWGEWDPFGVTFVMRHISWPGMASQKFRLRCPSLKTALQPPQIPTTSFPMCHFQRKWEARGADSKYKENLFLKNTARKSEFPIQFLCLQCVTVAYHVTKTL